MQRLPRFLFALSKRLPSFFALSALLVLGAFGWMAAAGSGADASDISASAEFNDSHFHLTNYIQEGITPQAFLQIMGSRVGRSTLLGIPLQQEWSYANSADYAPTYYLQTDAPLYYYSFTDAYIAEAFRSLAPRDQVRRVEPGDHRIEARLGGNYYPWKSRNARLNIQLINVDKSPVNSTFGFYVGQLKGQVLTIGMTGFY